MLNRGGLGVNVEPAYKNWAMFDMGQFRQALAARDGCIRKPEL